MLFYWVLLNSAWKGQLKSSYCVLRHFRTYREQRDLIEHFFMSLCKSVCTFIFLQAMIVMLKKYDPSLDNFLSCLAYNACYYISGALVVWMCGGSFIKIMNFVIRNFASNWSRFGLFVVTSALMLTIFQTFTVIRHFFSSKWFENL